LDRREPAPGLARASLLAHWSKSRLIHPYRR
jgi:hypothetical protein